MIFTLILLGIPITFVTGMPLVSLALIIALYFVRVPKSPVFDVLASQPSAKKPLPPRCRIIFIHPDLGIGGAERLIIDAAIAMSSYGALVDIVTPHHDPQRAFDETRLTGPNAPFRVRVAGGWVPRAIAHRGHVLFATVRMLLATATVVLCDVILPTVVADVAASAPGLRMPLTALATTIIHLLSPSTNAAAALAVPPTAIVVDQVTAPLLLLRALPRVVARPVVFYCHFPDKLTDQTLLAASTASRSAARRAYRVVFDALEEAGLAAAHCVLFNSSFTRSVFASTFPRFASRALPGVKATAWGPTGAVGAMMAAAVAPLSRSDDVAYPPVALDSLQATAEASGVPMADDGKTPAAARALRAAPSGVEREISELPDGRTRTAALFVSVNRYERKKAVASAVAGFAQFADAQATAASAARTSASLPTLVVAGGYDPRVSENVEYHQELIAIATAAGLQVEDYVGCSAVAAVQAGAQSSRPFPKAPGSAAPAAPVPTMSGSARGRVVFLKNITLMGKARLLATATAVMYTPPAEHFGIVPVEAMAVGAPVVAVAAAGPRESVAPCVIVDGDGARDSAARGGGDSPPTGVLVRLPDFDPAVDADACARVASGLDADGALARGFAAALSHIWSALSNDEYAAMRRNGPARVRSTFGADAFGKRLATAVAKVSA